MTLIFNLGHLHLVCKYICIFHFVYNTLLYLQNSLGEFVLFITPENGVINLTGYVLEEEKKERVDKSRFLSESSDETREIQTPDSPEIVKKRRPFQKSKIAIYFIYLSVDYVSNSKYFFKH